VFRRRRRPCAPAWATGGAESPADHAASGRARPPACPARAPSLSQAPPLLPPPPRPVRHTQRSAPARGGARPPQGGFAGSQGWHCARQAGRTVRTAWPRRCSSRSAADTALQAPHSAPISAGMDGIGRMTRPAAARRQGVTQKLGRGAHAQAQVCKMQGQHTLQGSPLGLDVSAAAMPGCAPQGRCRL